MIERHLVLTHPLGQRSLMGSLGQSSNPGTVMVRMPLHQESDDICSDHKLSVVEGETSSTAHDHKGSAHGKVNELQGLSSNKADHACHHRSKNCTMWFLSSIPTAEAQRVLNPSLQPFCACLKCIHTCCCCLFSALSIM